MAPKTKYSKEDIILAAFDIAKKDGLDAITIRRIAKQLGSSIAPIYVNFKDIDELVQEVVNHTLEIVKQLIIEQNSGHPFRDIGIASIKFAKQYSVLYRDLIMKNNPHMRHNEENMMFVVQQMQKDPVLAGFSEQELMDILLKMEIFQTGLAVMVANGLLPEYFTEEKMIEMLDNVAEDMIISTQSRKGKG
ncbi:TetR/AcrR family transcriptional regulator [Pseudogracilibacillus auburnensis]|uniref:TetR family transcriptional regulator n=1 Tax=Pseudogracilibacillus auburnensis TaxID=1494959 RepID=A0A2V3W013_9BACI|nr:TetR/AcrR family transcriptional regulator [Pseudogracilibacillus auburnensis]MBO1004689.1 TetR/AcrR family transcriptional regulator [Pseudogracilibacillus auburnensis]PXW85595.1 TetR family transcriptional regulator [Pseudogracilibacillus auburnensis]